MPLTDLTKNQIWVHAVPWESPFTMTYNFPYERDPAEGVGQPLYLGRTVAGPTMSERGRLRPEGVRMIEKCGECDVWVGVV